MMEVPVGQRALNNVKRVYSSFYHYLKEMNAIFKIREKEKSRKGERPLIVPEV